MNPRTDKEQAALLLESIKPELLKLLGTAPSFGSVGVDFTLHAGEITRIVSRVEVLRKLKTGGEA